MNDIILYCVVGGIVFSVLYGLALLKYDKPDQIKGKKVPHGKAGVDYHGHMAFANKGGEYFHGCRVAHFRNVRDLNDFFLPGNEGHLKLVGELIPQHDGSILAVYTAALTNDDLEDLDEWNRAQHEHFAQKRAQRAAEKEAAQEKVLIEASEQKRLAEIGALYEKRVGEIRGLPPGLERKRQEKQLNSGDLSDATKVSEPEA